MALVLAPRGIAVHEAKIQISRRLNGSRCPSAIFPRTTATLRTPFCLRAHSPRHTFSTTNAADDRPSSASASTSSSSSPSPSSSSFSSSRAPVGTPYQTHGPRSKSQTPGLRAVPSHIKQADVIEDLKNRLLRALDAPIPISSLQFNYLIELLCRTGQIEEAVRIVNLLKERGVELNEKLLYHLLVHCGRMNRFNEALAWFSQVKTISPVPAPFTYAAIIEACARHGRTEEMAKFYQEMRLFSIPGNLETYRWMLTAFGNAKRMSDAVELWQQISAETKLNLVLYNTMLDCCAKSGRAEYATVYWNEMLAQRIAPDHVSYTSYLHALGNGSTLYKEKVLPVFAEMKQKFTPSAQTYMILLDVFRNRFQLDEFIQIFSEALEQLREPRSRQTLYTRAILKIGSTTRYRLAFEWYKQMRRENLCLQILQTARLIMYLQTTPAKALEVFRDSQTLGREYICSPEILNAIVSVLCATDRVAEAKQIFDEAVRAGAVPNNQTSIALQRAAAKPATT